MDLFRLREAQSTDGVWAIAEGKCGQFGVFCFVFFTKKKKGKESQSPSAGEFFRRVKLLELY